MIGGVDPVLKTARDLGRDQVPFGGRRRVGEGNVHFVARLLVFALSIGRFCELGVTLREVEAREPDGGLSSTGFGAGTERAGGRREVSAIERRQALFADLIRIETKPPSKERHGYPDAAVPLCRVAVPMGTT